MCITVLKIFSLIMWCTYNRHDDQDDDKMNTLAFVNFLLVKIFPTLICQYFPLSKFCTIRYIAKISVVVLDCVIYISMYS